MSRYFARTPDIQNCQHSVCISVGTDWMPHGLPQGRAASRRGTEAAGRALSQGGPRACRAPATAEGRAPSHSPLPRGGGGRHGPRPSRAAPAAWTGRRTSRRGSSPLAKSCVATAGPAGGGWGGRQEEAAAPAAVSEGRPAGRASRRRGRPSRPLSPKGRAFPPLPWPWRPRVNGLWGGEGASSGDGSPTCLPTGTPKRARRCHPDPPRTGRPRSWKPRKAHRHHLRTRCTTAPRAKKLLHWNQRGGARRLRVERKRAGPPTGGGMCKRLMRRWREQGAALWIRGRRAAAVASPPRRRGRNRDTPAAETNPRTAVETTTDEHATEGRVRGGTRPGPRAASPRRARPRSRRRAVAKVAPTAHEVVAGRSPRRTRAVAEARTSPLPRSRGRGRGGVRGARGRARPHQKPRGRGRRPRPRR